MAVHENTVVIGTGPRKVIYLHGWFGHARAWGPLVNSLNCQDFSYAFIDYRGYGRLKGSGGPYTIEQIARDTLAAADRLDWPRFALVGHSMGGSAIQYALAEAPERVQALVGIAPVPATGVPFDEQTKAFFATAANDISTRRTIVDMSTGNRLTKTWIDATVQVSLDHSDADAFAAYFTAWSTTAFAERIQGQTLPVLAIAGQHDPAINLDVIKGTWLQHYPNARLEVMENAGHYPMDETPVALATSIERFLREVM